MLSVLVGYLQGGAEVLGQWVVPKQVQGLSPEAVRVILCA